MIQSSFPELPIFQNPQASTGKDLRAYNTACLWNYNEQIGILLHKELEHLTRNISGSRYSKPRLGFRVQGLGLRDKNCGH